VGVAVVRRSCLRCYGNAIRKSSTFPALLWIRPAIPTARGEPKTDIRDVPPRPCRAGADETRPR
jgi:hypothetical protein